MADDPTTGGGGGAGDGDGDRAEDVVVCAELNTQSERSSPARLKVYPQSESCGSSPASVSMELGYEIFPSVLMDLRRRILLSLYNIKFTKGDDQWRATDPSVLTEVQKFLKIVKLDLSIDKIKEQVIAMEDAVKLDMAQVKQISEDRDLYFVVFNYVMPEFVQETPPDEVLATAVMPEFAQDAPPTDVLATAVFTSNRKKMKMTCNPDCSTSSCQSDSSIGEHFSKLMENKEAVQELFSGKLSMENCTKKAESCGFDDDTLLEALDLLMANWEYRQIFMELNIKAAKAFILKKL